MDTSDLKLEHLRLIVKADLIPRFSQFIASGFRVKIETGCSIKELFCGPLGIAVDYFDNRIQTIFLDGKAVDNVDTAWVEDGSSVALSAAMPGLVGATFRKGGRYAPFRGSISYSKSKNVVAGGGGLITLKFFNMIAKELGPVFLQKGIIIEGQRLQDFVRRNSEELKAAGTSVHLNDAKVDLAALLDMNWENKDILVKVVPQQKL
ncbi:MAG: hypothetical protein JRF36_05485 [Deltaproteobacteria bacterium]|jgi:hypothetical protein|nr:hypothetical protein [Deltaproteobacteria bacterium]MBW2470336.1 hypothetical protein [Deltaproteobacteria bacterium]MBW2488375.1 hypothetical protein [Deltaproteobacteria bacterium]